MSIRPSSLLEIKSLGMDASMPQGLECRLLTLEVSREQMRREVRVVLQELLAERLKLPAAQLEIAISPGGRPFCQQAVTMGVQFSLSYAPPHACVVVGDNQMIGVDIERVVPQEPTWKLLEHVFIEKELQQWLQLQGGNVRRRAFTQAWTLKEAVLKAQGTGLAQPMQNAGVSFSNEGAVKLNGESTSWTCQFLNPGPEHVGVIVVCD